MLADDLWKSVAPYFKRKDILRMIPIGFGNEGIWRPKRLNECIKFNKYLSGTYFLPHIDGPWIPKWDEASIYTVVFYLNDNFSGGETQFLEGNDLVIRSGNHNCNVLATVKPKQGSCLIFNHDLLHQSTMVTKGVKYIARTEVIFEKIDSNMLVNPLEYATDPKYLKFLTIYKASHEEYHKGNPGKFMDLYYEALKMQVEAMRKSIPKHLPLTKTTFPEEIWLIILKELSYEQLLILMSVSKGMKEIVLDGEVWRSLYEKSFPDEKQESLNIHPSLQDWYTKFKVNKLKEFVMRSNKKFTVIDIGTNQLKYINQWQKDIKCVPSKYQEKKTYQQIASHFRPEEVISIELGSGWDILNHFQNTCSFTSQISEIIDSLSYWGDPFVYLRTPAVSPPKISRIIEVDMSVVSLNTYFRDSGLVISLGATFCWIQEVEQNKVLFTHLLNGSKEGTLGQVVTALIKKWKDWKEKMQKNEGSVVECCCIGGKCDKSNVEMIKRKIEMEGYKVNIISDIDKRITGPILGVFTRKKWN
uniref:F-box domain-containing protein n=1 Tax=Arcella intermedia TaxID=1963864 RepID=A0A6B2L1V9_9EUKA